MLSGIVGVIPTILVAGFAMKMTQSMFGQTQPTKKTRKKKGGSRGYGVLNPPRGNFSNIGL